MVDASVLTKCGYFARLSRHRRHLSAGFVSVYFSAAVAVRAEKPILLGHRWHRARRLHIRRPRFPRLPSGARGFVRAVDESFAATSLAPCRSGAAGGTLSRVPRGGSGPCRPVGSHRRARQKSMVRRTKIVCTLGPASWSPERIRSLIEAGMDVARINFSHGELERHAETLANVRAVSAATGRPVAVLGD